VEGRGRQTGKALEEATQEGLKQRHALTATEHCKHGFTETENISCQEGEEHIWRHKIPR